MIEKTSPTKTSRKSLFLLLLVLLFFGILLALPSFFSSEAGKNSLLRIVQNYIPGTLYVKDLDLSWFNRQEMKGITLKDPSGDDVAYIDRVVTETGLLHILFYQTVDDLQITSLQASIRENSPGLTNLQEALTFHPQAAILPPHEPLSIVVKDVNATLQTFEDDEPMIIDLKGITHHNDNLGSFALKASLAAKNVHALAQPILDGTIEANVVNFPVGLLDQMITLKKPNLSGFLSALLGPNLNLNVETAQNLKNASFILRAQSQNLAILLNGMLNDGMLSIRAPEPIQLTLLPELAVLFNHFMPTGPSVELLKPTHATLTLQECLIPLAFFQEPQDGLTNTTPHIQAQLDLDQTEINSSLLPKSIFIQKLNSAFNIGDTSVLTIQLNALSDGQVIQGIWQGSSPTPKYLAAIEKESINLQTQLTLNDLPVLLLEEFLGPDSHLINHLGQTVSLQTQTHVADQQATFAMDVKSPRLEANLIGVLNDQLELTLSKPAFIRYKMDTSLFPVTTHPLQFSNNMLPIQLVIDPPNRAIPLKQLLKKDWSTLELSGQLISEPFTLNQVSFPQTTFGWKLDTPENNLAVTFGIHPQFPINQSAGSITGTALINNWLQQGQLNLDQAKLNIDFQAWHFSTIVLEKLTGLPYLPAAFGHTADMDFTANISSLKKPFGSTTLHVKSDSIEANAAFEISESQLLTNQKPFTLVADLTPERFNALRRLLHHFFDEQHSFHELRLQAPSKATLTLSTLELPLKRRGLSQAKFHGSFAVDALQVLDPSNQQKLALRGLQASLDSEALAQRVEFNLRAQGTNGSIDAGHVTLNVALNNLFNQEGDLDIADISMTLQTETNQLPAGILCTIVCLDPSIRDKIEAVVGTTADIHLQAQLYHMNGAIQLEVKGNRGHFVLDGKLNNAILTLNKPLEIEIQVTPALSETILDELIPLLGGVIYADKPIYIVVDPQGFMLPLTDISPLTLQLGKASITLGKMKFSKDSQMANILSLLKQNATDDISVWFTPLYLQANNGLFRLERMDLLVMERYPVALWGKVDFAQDKVNLMVGLSGAALSQALGIQGLSGSDMLQLPLRGSVGKASIDKTKAITKIGALVAQTQGAHGQLLGAFLDLAGGTFIEEKPPAPTTNPLPWADLLKNENPQPEKAQSADQPKDKSKKRDRVKEKITIEDAAQSVINNFFR